MRTDAVTPLIVLVVVGSALRLYLAYNTGLPGALGGRVEVITPVTSFKRLQEGLFLFQNGIPPFEGGVYHQAPFLLALFHFITPSFAPLVFIFMDIVITICLFRLALYKNKLLAKEVWPLNNPNSLADGINMEDKKDDAGLMSKLKEAVDMEDDAVKKLGKKDPTKPEDSPVVALSVAVSFFLSPYSVMACVAMSTAGFSSLATVVAVLFATEGRRNLSIFALAFATHLSLYPVMLLPPIILMLSSSTGTKVLRVGFSSAILFAAFSTSLLWLSFTLCGSWDFIPSTYGVILFVPDLTPNIGIYWYFFIEMFDQFRVFFLIVFQILAGVFMIPLALRF
ncbi:hypothetical protein HDU67_004705 [Dinochytrium kinnereticum]|nr:hypothetical protein HDU67_004705 [Dinochytrium kinnereticum]